MDDNLRRGNNTENLGLHLLRGIGAVAPVPRDQDVGVDAVVTLLKRDEGRRLLAGSNVFVQLKSSSIRSIVFTEDDTEWLHRLELPYFIGSVNSVDASIALYAVHALRHFGTLYTRSELCLDATPGCINAVADDTEFTEWVHDDQKNPKAKVFLGPPILEWTMSDVCSRGFLTESNRVLEAWASLFHENKMLESFGEAQVVSWETGDVPNTRGSIGAYSPRDRSRDSAVRLFNLALKRISIEASLDGDVTAIRSLLDAVTYFKKYGVEDRDIVAAGVAAKLVGRPR